MEMPLRKALLATLVVVQFFVGAGAGERVVYFGAAHVRHEHCPHDDAAVSDAGRDHAHDHSSGFLKGILGYVPIIVPVDVRHGHDSHTACDHIHIWGHDSGAVTGPVVVPRPAPAALPEFFQQTALAGVAMCDGVAAAVAAVPLLRPPSAPSDSQVRLLI